MAEKPEPTKGGGKEEISREETERGPNRREGKKKRGEDGEMGRGKGVCRRMERVTARLMFLLKAMRARAMIQARSVKKARIRRETRHLGGQVASVVIPAKNHNT